MERRTLTAWGREAIDSVLLQLDGHWRGRVRSRRVTDRILRATIRRIHTPLAGQSIAAVAELLNGGRAEIDHAIPLAVIVGQLLSRKDITRDELETFLSERIVRVQLTRHEHRVLLCQHDLAEQMPLDWDGQDVFARYRKVGILLADGSLEDPTRRRRSKRSAGNVNHETSDRSYWEAKADPSTVALADRVLALARTFAPALTLRYRKNYIGFSLGGEPVLFAKCRPRRTEMRLEVFAPFSEQMACALAGAGLHPLEFDGRQPAFRVTLGAENLTTSERALTELLKSAYDSYGSAHVLSLTSSRSAGVGQQTISIPQ